MEGTGASYVQVSLQGTVVGPGLGGIEDRPKRIGA